MGIVTKFLKYGIVFAAGFYLGYGCEYKLPNPSKLEQDVVKYEQKIIESAKESGLFPQRP